MCIDDSRHSLALQLNTAGKSTHLSAGVWSLLWPTTLLPVSSTGIKKTPRKLCAALKRNFMVTATNANVVAGLSDAQRPKAESVHAKAPV